MAEAANESLERAWRLFWSLLFAALLIVVVGLLSPPRWETNDDVSMSMIAGGYGGAAYGSPNLIFSNVLWGKLVRWMPVVAGVPGYSLATLVAVAVACWSAAYLLLAKRLELALVGLAVAAVMIRPVALPQFTLTAGLTAAVGVLALSGSRSTAGLIGSTLFFFFAFLVRWEELVAVVLVGLPFLPWQDIGRDKRCWVAAAVLLFACGLATWLDRLAYVGPEWNAFRELNPVRAQFTDYGAASIIKAQPGLLQQSRFTANDIDLISNWFFVDPMLADPARLRSLLEAVGRGTIWTIKPWLGVQSLGTLWQPALRPLVIGTIALFAIRPTARAALAGVVLVVIAFAVGLLGRPGPLRIFYPLLGILWLLSIRQLWNVAGNSRWIALATAAAICAWSANVVWMAPKRPASVTSFAEALQSEQPLVVWGGSFPFEFAYPVLASQTDLEGLQIYGLGTTTLAPFSEAVEAEKSGRGFLKRLQSNGGIPMIVNADYLRMLSTYCREHLGVTLHEVQTKKVEGILIRWIACPVSQ